MKYNPNGNTYTKPQGYTDLGWQLHSGNSEEVKKCHDLGHRRKEFDNSLHLHRSTDVIFICDECKNIYHIDMSD
jgi:hypothetical protein